jgi:tetratricopeptide (TPR) repeat protein
MTNASIPEFKEPHNSEPENKQISGQSVHQNDLTNDPDYAKLIEHFQNAEFTQCELVLNHLEKRYKDDPVLQKFKDELQMKLSVQNMTATIQKEETRQKRKVTLNLSIFAIVATLIVLIALFLSLTYFLGRAANDQPQPVVEDSGPSQLTLLYDQAEQLLQVGRPGPAAEIIEKIRAIDPEFTNLSDLSARTEDLQRLEAQYQAALALNAENEIEQALVIFQEIETEKPGLWDVSQQIAAIETTLQIAQYMQDGDAAYQVENWSQVISAYESALLLDPNLDDPVMKEQLLRAYLNQIINMLQDEGTSIEDIERAERYYRKAIALIPQSREFAREKVNLQEVSSNLLELKFTQIAKEYLADKNQTSGSIAQAVSFLRKAANLKPKNTALQTDLQTAEYYQIGFQNFIEMNWTGAITNLSQVISRDPNYADGNAGILLFEAYSALGKQYYNAGIYLDALKNFEQAELLAWTDLDNLAKLFQIQVHIGDSLGKLEDYENAVSYYQYALNAIQASAKITGYPVIATNLTAAGNSLASGRYQDAFEAYQDVLEEIDVVYTILEIEINDGANIALFAHDNLSTLDDVLKANDLQNQMVITFGRNLLVPIIEN